MDDSVFRIVVALGVGLVAVAFIVQALVMLALYRASRKTQGRMEELADRVEPVIDTLEPILRKTLPVIDKVGPAVEKAGAMFVKADAVLATANRIMEENRPRISDVAEQVAVVARSSRQQVERIGELLHEAGGLALTRLEQIDNAVGSTVEHVEQAGDAVRRVVMRPVREVNGIAAGISAAVATLVRGRKSSVDTATQDEEMFI